MKSDPPKARVDGAGFDNLFTLTDNWHDGKGLPPDKGKLEAITVKIIGHFPEHVPLPAIVPTPERNVLFEWILPGDPSIEIDLASARVKFHQ